MNGKPGRIRWAALSSLALALCLASGSAAGKGRPKPPDKGVSLRIAAAYAVERQGFKLGFVSGRALAGGPEGTLDVVFALDGSSETAFTSGVDVNKDGKVTGTDGKLTK